MKCCDLFIFVVLNLCVLSAIGQLAFRQPLNPFRDQGPTPPSSCRTSTGGQGTCKVYRQCPSTTGVLQFRAPCGLYGGKFYTCCPEKTSEPLTSLNTVAAPLLNFQCGQRGSIPIQFGFASAGPIGLESFIRQKRASAQLSSLPAGGLDSFKFNPGLVEVPFNPGDNRVQVVGGVPSFANSWPWMILLGRKQGPRTQYFCSAVLINQQYALTAAHCVLDLAPFFARLGEHDHTQPSTFKRAPPQDVNVVDVTVHPKYKINQGYNDVAILKLARPVTITNEVRPVCLPWENLANKNLIGGQVVITGWGSEQFGGAGSPILREVQVTVFDPSTCQTSYSTLPEFKTAFPKGMTRGNIVCAGNTLGGKDSCQGDSGGPIVHRGSGGVYSLAGIISKGYGCGKQDFPGLYAPIRNYETLKWIKNVAF